MLAQYMKIDGKAKLIRNWVGNAVIWLIAAIVMLVIMRFAFDPDERTIAPVGCVVVMLVFVISKMIPRSSYLDVYETALSMNRTRKSFLKSYVIVELICNTVLYIALWGLYTIECTLYKVIFSCTKYEFRLDALFHPLVIVGAILLLSVMGMFVAAVYTVHPGLAYALWLACCFMPSFINSRRWKGSIVAEAGRAVKNFFCSIPLYGTGILMTGVAVLFFALAWKRLSGYSVRGNL